MDAILSANFVPIVWTIICSFLNTEDILHLRSTSKLVKNNIDFWIKHSASLQWKIRACLKHVRLEPHWMSQVYIGHDRTHPWFRIGFNSTEQVTQVHGFFDIFIFTR